MRGLRWTHPRIKSALYEAHVAAIQRPELFTDDERRRLGLLHDYGNVCSCAKAEGVAVAEFVQSVRAGLVKWRQLNETSNKGGPANG